MLEQSGVLQVTLFGCPKVIQPQVGAPIALGQKANELLAVLLLRGHHAHHREKLANLLWSEAAPGSAAHSLRTTLWRLRQALEPPGVAKGTYLSTASPGEICFNWKSEYLVDVLEFEAAMSRCDLSNARTLSDNDLQVVERALRLYEGELLEGHFDDWVIYERERLRDLYIRGLGFLMRAVMERRDDQQAIALGRRVLVEDPLRESVHRDLMQVYARNGQRAEAIKLYEQLRTTLDTELAVAPASETTRVYAQILQRPPRAQQNASREPANEIHDAIGAMQCSLDTLESSIDALEEERLRMDRLLRSFRELLRPEDDPPN